MPTGTRGMKFKYSSGIAPLVTAKEYTDLIANYKKSGQFPHILKLGGMAIDTTQNRNKWRVPLADLNDVAAQLNGAPLMKDHDIDHVDSIIGKVEDAWVEEDGTGGGKVMWKGECSDESLIQKILLGYVKNNSIQIAVPQAYCDNCITHLGKSEEEASLDNLDFPCPRCGSLEMVARHPAVLEQSLVAIPAYEHADITPVSFRAALDTFQDKRLENAKKAGWYLQEGKTLTPKSSAPDLSPLVISAFNAVTEVEMAVLETQARLLQGELEEAIPQQIPPKQRRGVEHVIERMGGPEEWTPEPVIDEDKGEQWDYMRPDPIQCDLCKIYEAEMERKEPGAEENYLKHLKITHGVDEPIPETPYIADPEKERALDRSTWGDLAEEEAKKKKIPQKEPDVFTPHEWAIDLDEKDEAGGAVEDFPLAER